MKKNYTGFITLLSLFPVALIAQTPDWSTGIAQIFYNNCTVCHNHAGIAPFPIESYNDAVNYSGIMPGYINTKLMPPWPPDPTYRHFVNERVLTQGQIDSINDWINGGTPEGDPNLAPPVPHFVNGEVLGTPDLVVQIPTYTSTATTTDDYACFVLPLNIPEDKYVKAIQVLPGNPKIVHHAIVMIDTTATMTNQDCMLALANLPGSNSALTLTSYAAGVGPTVFPSGEAGLKMGERLKKGSNIMLQVHYPPGTAGEVDSTRVLFYLYSDSEVTATPPLRLLNVGLYTMNWALAIPANTVQTYTASYPGPFTITYTGSATSTTADYSLFAVDPHMHLVGRQITSWGVTPTNDTIPFERVNNWQFSWQAYYFFQSLIKLPMGSKIFGTATYDNTTNNPYNPNSPPQLVLAGENTNNEMMLIAYMYMPYEQGDENYNIDSLVNLALATYTPNTTGIKPVSAGSQPGFSVYPNPTPGPLLISPYNLLAQPAEITVTDLLGRQLMYKKFDNLNEPVTLSASDLLTGVYLVRLRQNNFSSTQKVIVGDR
jgi:hypothetical protein